jgi:hypothetical protein
MTQEQPKALQLASIIDVCAEDPMWSNHTEISKKTCNAVSAELRSQHARIAELEAQIEAVGAGGVQALSAGPVGWKLVPMEPTQAMLRAATEHSANCGGMASGRSYYAAMLAASPTPPAEQPAAQSMQAALKAAPGEPGWWRKRADEIETQVALTGSPEAMRCYTDMRTLLQAAAEAAPQQEAQELVKCSYGDSGYACCEGGPCKAEVHNDAIAAAPQAAPAQEATRLEFVLANGLPMEAGGYYRYHGFIDQGWHKTKVDAIDAALAAQGGA